MTEVAAAFPRGAGRRALFIIAAVAALFSAQQLSAEDQRKPHVILIILDTLRADHLGFYGYKRATSPVLDKFAKVNTAFLNTVAAAPWTPPSVATILTGLFPATHRMMPPDGRGLARRKAVRLSSKLLTAAELFQAQGYRTRGITPNPWITKEFGFDQGYEEFYVHLRKDAKFITDQAIEIFDGLAGKPEPFFVSLHYLDPHDPYRPPAPFDTLFSGANGESFAYPERMQKLINLYDGEIRFLDQELGRLFEHLRKLNVYENSVILVTADHGEQFMEHGDHRHGFQLFDEEVHVPLFLKTAPAGPARKTAETASLVDVLPTLLQAAGLALPPQLQGVSLLDQSALAKREGVVSEITRKYEQRALTNRAGLRLLVGTQEVGQRVGDDIFAHPIGVFDFQQDPFGQTPIVDLKTRAALVQKLRSQWAGLAPLVSESETVVELDQSTVEQLKSLGYLE